MGAFPSEIAEPDMIRPCLAIDSKKFIYLRHDPDRALIFGIDFERLEELSPGMRPARCMDDSGSADVIIGPVSVTLEDALEVTQESFRPFSFTTHSKVEDYGPLRATVLPKVGLVVFSSAIMHLHIHRGLVCLDVVAL